MITLNSNNVQRCTACGALVMEYRIDQEAHARAIHGLDPDNDETLFAKLWENID